MTRVRVKICCISSVQEARNAIEYGASALGLVGNMPSGPGVIEDMQENSESLNKFYIQRAASIDSLLTIVNFE